MTSHLLGSASAGWLDLSALVPYDGATMEYIQAQSVSIAGVTTTNRRAIKRRWSLPLPVADPWRYAQLANLAELPGPFWLYDGTRPGLTPPDRRLMRGWVDSTGVIGIPSGDARLTLVASRTYGWEPLVSPAGGNLFAVPAGQPSITFAVTAKAAVAGNVLTMGLRWYTAAGALVSNPTQAKTLTTAEARYAYAATPPMTAVYGQPTLLTTATGVTVTDPAIGPTDRGPAWYVASFDGFTVTNHNSLQHSITYQLREV